MADGSVRISDFGTARAKRGGSFLARLFGGRYPVAAEGTAFPERADAYNFGLLLWELLSESYATWFGPSFRLSKAQEMPCHDKLQKLIRSCCHMDAAMRPTFPTITRKLRWIQSQC
jgi:hypothetical protein